MPFTHDIKGLLEAGAHYGHQKSRWNPIMRPFIYGERNGVHIINLALTVNYAQEAYDKAVEVVSSGHDVLFVGTKPQAREALKAEAVRANQYYMVNRWLGGTLTNFRTMRKSIEKIHRYDEMEEQGVFQHMTKKEILRIERERSKLMENLEGIIELKRLPGLVFVVDIAQDSIAVDEANKLGIPVAALCDTNVDPSRVDLPIPANDDAVRSIRYFASMLADACLEGEDLRQERLRAEEEDEVGSESLADQFIDADEEDDLLSMRKVIKKIGKKEQQEGESAEAEGEKAAAPEGEAEASTEGSEAAEDQDASTQEAQAEAKEAPDNEAEASDESGDDASEAAAAEKKETKDTKKKSTSTKKTKKKSSTKKSSSSTAKSGSKKKKTAKASDETDDDEKTEEEE